MPRLPIATVLVALVLVVLPFRAAHAQTILGDDSALRSAIANLDAGGVAAATSASVDIPRSGPSRLMWSLYSTTALVQGLDARSTFRAFDAGAVETNPMVSWASSNRPGFVALKAGIAAAAIYTAHSLSKEHKVRAVFALITVNCAYAMLVAHNYQVANRP